MSRFPHLIPRLALVALALNGAAAMAQSAYTLTTLGKPSGAYSFVPTTLDDQGVVRGGMFYRSGYKFVATYPYFGFLPAYLYRAVSWNGVTATAATTLGGKYLFPRLTNNSGVQVGPFNKTSELGSLMQPEVFPSAAATFQGGSVYAPTVGSATMLRQGSTDTDLSALLAKSLGTSNTSSFKSTFTANGMNNVGAIAGFFSRPVSASGEVTFVKTPLVYRNGSYSTLDVGTYGNFNVLDINDAGTVVGQVTRYREGSGYQSVPVLWVNQQLAAVGDDSLVGHEPLSINNAGQVLMVGKSRPFAPGSPAESLLPLRSNSLIWLNNTVTPLISPNDEAVRATAMNDQGTVVGCALRAFDLRTVDARPFLWKNGVMLDLVQELKAKGVSLPAGTKLGCPTAINNSGSILTYTYTNQTPSVITWVRLNAKP